MNDGLFLHVFHPAFHMRDWTTENFAVVLATKDRKSGMVLARASGEFQEGAGLVHQVFPITAGMVLVAKGYDHSNLTVNGEYPPEA